MPPPPPIDDEAAVYRDAAREVLADAERAEAELAPLYQETSERIQERLRKGADNMNAVQLRGAVQEEFQRTLFKRRKVIASVIESGAKKGPAAAKRTLRIVFGEPVKAYEPTDAALEFVRSRNAAREVFEDGSRPTWRLVNVPIDQIEAVKTWDASKLPPIRKGLSEGAKLPAVRLDVVRGQAKLSITDGIHRIAAAREAGLTHVPAIVEEVVPRGGRARRFFGQAGVRKAEIRTSKRALEEGAQRIAGRATVDKVSLSTRIRRWDAKLGEEMAQAVERGIKSKKGILQIAKKIEKLDNVTEGLPKYLQEVEALARRGELKELKSLAKRYTERAKRLLGETQVGGAKKASPYSLRSSTQKFLRDVQKAGQTGIDGVVKTYVEERAQWRARVIARQESVEAMRASYKAQLKGKRGVVCIEHRLSGRHPKADICDYWAKANLHGLGPGRYPLGKEPPLHVGCLCYHVAVMDEKTYEREGDGVPDEFLDSKSPDGIGWLRSNPDRAAAILGPTRHEAFKRGFSVLDEQHQLVPVGELVGRMSRAAE